MQAAHCALVVALKYAPDNPGFALARQHLETAIALSDEYYKTQYSIFWKTSSEKVKRRIRSKCNQLAFDIYSQMLELACLVNEYAAEKTSLSIPEPQSWQEFIHNLDCAFDWIEREHPKEIYIKQLTLL
ncbi:MULTISPECIES: hypothetical protein [unclassified Tolypothrix]|uniref:hypothetical protein n=1 Tax=unclassified Tolypothrix TaxID=2649714 RepID=UPI0005EAA5F9|nr:MULTISPECIES: hypothetical protein [unclassified Tolypothrix]BAY91363.1 hypothetical protein NIES3275_33860 [Microchaete diplosiphon NIES-3275]EKF04510.1 hypothetical protein FDUTEX481_01779 [Tolypothrix sp. PCC 7601]MBE9080950.1 hypothetical protein [Tolypothrix sp. LEGE 11397]UYD25417.1 hypothetical protein HGR01_29285 [Tolypothrix sp. PCC 7712]UYD32338.1 hypothetical protein HG267_25275 [Tolypothrix sp. PCC 7601]